MMADFSLHIADGYYSSFHIYATLFCAHTLANITQLQPEDETTRK